MTQSETTSAACGGEKAHPSWFALVKLALAAKNERGVFLRLGDVAALASSPIIGPMMTAAHVYGASNDGPPAECLRSNAVLAAPAAQGGTEVGWRKVMRDLLHEYERNICTHEDTHRGGAIWTICDACGAKWADDRGGFVPYSPPDAVVAAEALLASLPPPARAAGGGSGDLGALSAGARQKPDAGIEEIVARYAVTGKKAIEDAIATQRPAGPGAPSRCIHCDAPLTAEEREFYSTGCERCMSKFHAAMVAEDLSLLPSPPTPDLGAQGEQRIRYLESVLGDIANARASNEASGFPQGLHPDPAAWMEQQAASALYEAPAAPRTGSGVTVDDLKTILRQNLEVREEHGDAWDDAGGPWIDGHDEAARAILALFAQAPRDGGETQGGWQSIETAPKDGTWIEAWIPKKTPEDDADFAIGGVDSVRWSGKEFWWSRHVGCSYPAACPTHWRPLPTPPSGGETIRQDNTSGGL